MRRFVTLTLTLATASTVAGVYLKEALNREQLRNVVSAPAPAEAAEGPKRGLITQVDIRNRSLEIEVNGREEQVFWDDRTLITFAKHRVKPSALAPGVKVSVDAHQRDNRLEASQIVVSPPDSSDPAR